MRSLKKKIFISSLALFTIGVLSACGSESKTSSVESKPTPNKPTPNVSNPEYNIDVNSGVFVGTNLEAKISSTVPLTYTWYVREEGKASLRIGEGKARLIGKDLFTNKSESPNYVRYCVTASSINRKCSIWTPVKPIKPTFVQEGTIPFIVS